MIVNRRALNLVPGKLYKVIDGIGCTEPNYDVIPTSTIVMLIEIKPIQQYANCKRLVFLVGKQTMSANFGDSQFPDYLAEL